MFKLFLVAIISVFISGCATSQKTVLQQPTKPANILSDIYVHYFAGDLMVFSDNSSIGVVERIAQQNKLNTLNIYRGTFNMMAFVTKEENGLGRYISHVNGQHNAYYPMYSPHISLKASHYMKEHFAPRVVEISNSLSSENNWQVYDVSLDKKKYQWILVNGNCEPQSEYNVKDKKWNPFIHSSLSSDQVNIVRTNCTKFN